MWGRLRERLLSAGIVVLFVAWFLGAIAIATDLFGVEPRRSNLWVVMLIFWAPLVVWLIAGEVVHLIRFGPRMPGRHSRGPE